MSDALRSLANLKRPRLLVRAALSGLEQYNRRQELSRLLPGLAEKGPAILSALISAEAECDEARRSGAANYSITRHISLLVALLAEARMVR